MQIVLIGAAVAGGWWAWKRIKREMARLDREDDAVRKLPSETLERDPETGRYRAVSSERRAAPEG